MDSSWKSRRVLVTGGASFIGSHLVDRLVEAGARVRVVDNLSVGLRENIDNHLRNGTVDFIQADLREPDVARNATTGQQVVFHLAADHGGRGYIATHPVECSTNMVLDGTVFAACHHAAVEKVVFASSGCVYPTSRQMDPTEDVLLSEESVGPPYEADDLYGWAKLMGELTLRAYHDQYGLRSVSCRLFTVFGPRCGESHAVLAMIGRAFVRQDPFVVWGTGEQVRNWTFVDDTVRGMMLAALHIDDGSAVNIGTSERVTVLDCALSAMKLAGYDAPVSRLLDMPSGVLNRVADSSRARHVLGWEASIPFAEGLRRTYEWYVSNKDAADVADLVSNDLALLTHRAGSLRSGC